MSERIRVPLQIQLEYYRRPSSDGSTSDTWLVDPRFTNELRLALYADDDSMGAPTGLADLGRLQVELAGTQRALEELGRYLIGMARVETNDPDLHDHFEDVRYGMGGTVHLIIRRLS